MTLVSAAAFAATPRHVEHRLLKARLADQIPRQIGPWQFVNEDGLVVAVADEDSGPRDGYDQLVTRTYAAPGLPTVMLLLAYGSTQGGSLQLHRPETCYPGQGFGLSQFAEADFHFVAGLPVYARRFTADGFGFAEHP